MIAFVAFLSLQGSLVAPAAGEVTAEQALVLAKQVLRDARVTDEVKLKNESRVDGTAIGHPGSSLWGFSFSRPRGGYTTLYLMPNGELDHLQTQLDPHAPRSRGEVRTEDPFLAETASKLLAPTHPVGEFKLEDVFEGQTDTTVTAYFAPTKNHLRFLNLNPHFAYMVSFERKSGEMTWFSRPPALPEVNASRSDMDPELVAATLRQYAIDHPDDSANRTLTSPGPSTKAELTVELGYFKFPDEPTARLVWQGRLSTNFAGLGKRSFGPLPVVMDAIDGTLIKAESTTFGG